MFRSYHLPNRRGHDARVCKDKSTLYKSARIHATEQARNKLEAIAVCSEKRPLCPHVQKCITFRTVVESGVHAIVYCAYCVTM